MLHVCWAGSGSPAEYVQMRSAVSRLVCLELVCTTSTPLLLRVYLYARKEAPAIPKMALDLRSGALPCRLSQSDGMSSPKTQFVDQLMESQPYFPVHEDL